MPLRLLILSLSTALVLSLVTVPAEADETPAEWPQYRGANRDGVSTETGLIRSWPEGSSPTELWRRAIGPAFSGLTVDGARLYTAESDAEGEYLLALDTRTGETIWRAQVGPAFINNFGDGPRTTPTLGDDALFLLTGNGRLVSLDVDGKERWAVDLQTDFAVEAMRFGFSTAPILVDEDVIVEVGASDGRSVAAFKRADGALAWTAGEGAAAYGSPIRANIAGKDQLVFLNRQGPLGLSPEGEVLWSFEWAPDGGVKPALPIFVPPNLLFFSASYDIGALALRLEKGDDGIEAQQAWQSRVMRNHFNSSVLVGETLYGFDNSSLKAINPRTGEQLWAKRGRLGKGSLIAADGLLIVLSEKGQLMLVEANPEEYRQLASAQVLSGRCWTSPTLASGRLYLRNREELLALDLLNAPSPAEASEPASTGQDTSEESK